MHPGILGLKQRTPLAISLTRSTSKGNTLSWGTIEGNWKQFKAHAKQKRGKLTDDNLEAIAGKREQLAAKIQESYCITEDQAEMQVKAFEETHKDYRPSTPA